MGAFGRLLIQKWGGNLKSYDGDRYVEKRTPSKEEIDEKERKEFLNEIKQRAIRYNNFDVYDETFFEFLDGTIDIKSFEEFKEWRDRVRR
jgi:hypothetical protein